MGARSLRRRLVLLSGGLDSAATLYNSPHSETQALFVDYGQVSSAPEEKAARTLAGNRGVDLEILRVKELGRLGSGTLIRAGEAHGADGHDADQKQEWFPARNLMLCAIAAIPLARTGGGELALGALSDSYRDSRLEFFQSVEQAICDGLPTDSPVKIIIPSEDRLTALRTASTSGLEVRLTFSCNRRHDRHCWRCSSCHDRVELIAALHERGCV
jgi:7-cyano-7-deazaguanine synthase in queuosine biosynthesis